MEKSNAGCKTRNCENCGKNCVKLVCSTCRGLRCEMITGVAGCSHCNRLYCSQVCKSGDKTNHEFECLKNLKMNPYATENDITLRIMERVAPKLNYALDLSRYAAKMNIIYVMSYVGPLERSDDEDYVFEQMNLAVHRVSLAIHLHYLFVTGKRLKIGSKETQPPPEEKHPIVTLADRLVPGLIKNGLIEERDVLVQGNQRLCIILSSNINHAMRKGAYIHISKTYTAITNAN